MEKLTKILTAKKTIKTRVLPRENDFFVLTRKEATTNNI